LLVPSDDFHSNGGSLASSQNLSHLEEWMLPNHHARTI
jgi:hypothetical protein